MPDVELHLPALVIGDLHLVDEGRWQPWRRFLTAGRAVDQVLAEIEEALGGLPGTLLCTGDTGSLASWHSLAERFDAPHAVYGNADSRELKEQLPGHLSLRVGKARLLVVHGWGSPRYIVDRIMHRFGWEWEAVLFGHTHRPLATRFEQVLFGNPGSATDIRIARRRTFGLLQTATEGPPAKALGSICHAGLRFSVIPLSGGNEHPLDDQTSTSKP